MKLLQNLSTDLPEDVNKSLFSIYSPGGHLVPHSGIVLAILVDGHPRNIPVLLFQNPSSGSGEEVV